MMARQTSRTRPPPKSKRTKTFPVDLDVWNLRKRKSLAIADAYIRLGGGYAPAGKRMRDCAPQLFWVASTDGRTTDERVILVQTCKSRFCDVCSVLRSRKVFLSIAPRFEELLRDIPGARAALATFTMPNVPIDECRPACKRLLAAFRRLTQQKAFKAAVVGWMRSVEITINRNTGQLHPHLHALLVFRRGYFSKENNYFISQDRWVRMWQKAIKDPACRIVDIRVLRSKDKSRPLSSALAEVCKYPMKPMDLITQRCGAFSVDPEVLRPLHDGLRNMRLFAFGGRLRALDQTIAAFERTTDEWVLDAEELDAFIADFEPEVISAANFRWQGHAYLDQPNPTPQPDDPAPVPTVSPGGDVR